MSSRIRGRIFLGAGLTTSAVLVALPCYRFIRRDRWALIRKHPWKCIRQMYKRLYIYQFARKLDRAHRLLPAPEDEVDLHPGAKKLLDEIIEDGPNTYQKKETNRVQIESLVDCVCRLVERTGKQMVLDLGAGKALFTRAVYEAMNREVACTALDSRAPHKGDRFYDPTEFSDSDESYNRVVADVRRLSNQRMVEKLMKNSNGRVQSPDSVVAVTKHLCGGATDSSLMALCRKPLTTYIHSCCLAPCCHQKTKRHQYCNMEYLQSLGFCRTHVGLRGETLDADFRTLGILISVSKMPLKDLQDFEFRNSQMLLYLGYARMRDLGRKARRILEEGRMRYLREHGFQVKLVRYCDEDVTGDNLAIIARRR